ncbi:hypothetical protein Lalb_Chr18g0050931 [Lupinus albus]|uniref:Uncharacterized protein n=1 Tax=Lupinus albus TaxID=3870 RepID=A0A6A4NKH7_LUPAL|nr:hypothetical protein Lalb_Chr18g0050931 [Lupinus albus]
MHLNYMKDMLITYLNTLMYKIQTSCIICICLTLFNYICLIIGSHPLLSLFFCLYFVYEYVCCICTLDIY